MYQENDANNIALSNRSGKGCVVQKNKTKMATKDRTLVAIFLRTKQLLEYLYQSEASFRLDSSQ
jgi:hypothetical protein